MADLDPELASWLQGGSSASASNGASAAQPTTPADGVDPELSAWLSGGGSSDATSAPAARAADSAPAGSIAPAETPLSLGGRLLSLLDRPRNALWVAAKHTQDVRSPLFDPEMWKGLWRGLTGEETYTGSDYLKESAPHWSEQHPVLRELAGAGLNMAGDPLMYGGQAVAKGMGTVMKGAGQLALGTPEAMAAVETMANPLLKLAQTSKPAQTALAGARALQSVARQTAGAVNLDALLAHLPGGNQAAQAIRNYRSAVALEQEINRRKVAELARGFTGATSEEHGVLPYVMDSPTAAEAEARATAQAAKEAAATAGKVAEPEFVPGPWDDPDIARQQGQVWGAHTSLPGPELEAVRGAAAAAGQTPEAVVDDIAQRVYGYPPGQTLSPAQRGQVTRAFQGAQSLDEGLANLRDILHNEGVAGSSELGTAIRNKEAMNHVDPFDMSTEQRHQTLSDELERLNREHNWEKARYGDQVKQQARQAARDINAANSSTRNQLWQEILGIGRIRPGSGTAGAELTRQIPSFLKSAEKGWGLDEIASSWRGGKTEQELVDEIRRVAGLRPVAADSPEAIRQAEAVLQMSPEGQQALDTMTAYRQQIEETQHELEAARAELAARRAPFDDLPTGDYPRPPWSAQPSEEEMARREAEYLALERAGMGEGAHDAAQEALRSGNGVSLAGVPEDLRGAAQSLQQKYGQGLAALKAWTDQLHGRAARVIPELGYVPNYFPRVSRVGEAGDNALTRFFNRLRNDDAVLARPDQLKGRLTLEPGFSRERSLPTLRNYVTQQAGQGRHAVLDWSDAYLTHANQVSAAEKAYELRNQLLGMGDNIAVELAPGERLPIGYMDMSNIPGWNRIAVEKNVARAVQDALLPAQRSAPGILYDQLAHNVKAAVFQNPLIHGMNLAKRAIVSGENPLGPLVSRGIRQEVREIGPTLTDLAEHGGARVGGHAYGPEAAASALRDARLATGEATLGDRARNLLDRFHGSLWNYDKGLRVQYAQELAQRGLSPEEIAKEVNRVYSSGLDPTATNRWVQRAFLAPAWMGNSLRFGAETMLDPRMLAVRRLKDAVNAANTGHDMAGNPEAERNYVAVSGPGSDDKQTFINFKTPDQDAIEALSDPVNFLWGRLQPLVSTTVGLAMGNSNVPAAVEGERSKGLDYMAPGQGGPLFGYGTQGFGPDVDLRTQQALKLLAQMTGAPVGTIVNEADNMAGARSPGRDTLLRLGGMYAKDANEQLQQALDRRDQIQGQRAAIRARALREWRRQNSR